MKNLSRKLRLGLTPLVLSLAVSQAYAVERYVFAGPGADGANAVANGAAGAHGGAGQPMVAEFDLPPALDDLVTFYGGQGGAGGIGGARDTAVAGASGGDGGHGGDGGAVLGGISSVWSALAAQLSNRNVVFGGNGGAGGASGDVGRGYPFPDVYNNFDPTRGIGGNGGQGGFADSRVRTVATGDTAVVASAAAVGGRGGNASGYTGRVGAGGGAVARAYGQSDSGAVSVAATARGGDAGVGDFLGITGGARGGDATLVDAVSGSTSGALTLSQEAVGGTAGGRYLTSRADWADRFEDNGGGHASSSLVLDDARAGALSVLVGAHGGDAVGVNNVAGVQANYRHDGGNGHATLTLASRVAGAAVEASVNATGGVGGSGERATAGSGGAARAVGTISGLGAVNGTANARGGHGGAKGDFGGGGGGGAAHADLTLAGAGMVTGAANAYGGDDEHAYYSPAAPGDADASLTLHGAGASGASYAAGLSSHSSVNAVTTGALAVDVLATAQGSYNGGGATAVVSVASGVDSARAGNAAVRARATAASANAFNAAGVEARLSVRASGAIDGASSAIGGNSYYGPYGSPGAGGNAVARAEGIGSGANAVAISAHARGGDTNLSLPYATGGSAAAEAYGRSVTGAVTASADARAGADSIGQSIVGRLGSARADATALADAVGGRATATASAWGLTAEMSASSGGRDQRGAAVQAGATGAIGVRDYGYEDFTGKSAAGASSTVFDAARFALADLGGDTHVVSNVSTGAALDGVAAPALDSTIGTGMQALAASVGGRFWEPYQLSVSNQFQFEAYGGQHLLIDFVSASFLNGGFDVLDFSITNNGAGLFARSFTSLDEAMSFFSGNVLDLGAFGAGAQDVHISTVAGFNDARGFAFNYVLGAGAALAPVPEASSWTMLVLGLGTLVLVARRRRGQAVPA